MTWLRRAASVALAAAALLSATEAKAAGYMLREQSGSMLGQAFAGQNAYAMDPSIIFYKSRRHVGAGGHAIQRGRQLHLPGERIRQ
jgi:long-subunit fatty acid transport protein